ncbi:MAG: MATE family efflux transporter [Butyricimonas faecihominis]
MRINSLYYKQNINIAFPIMLSLAGQAIVQMADNIMVGQLGAPELAAVSLAGAIIMNTMVVGMGIATGLTPLWSQAHALDDKERIAGFSKFTSTEHNRVTRTHPFLVHAHALPFHDGTTREL